MKRDDEGGNIYLKEIGYRYCTKEDFDANNFELKGHNLKIYSGYLCPETRDGLRLESYAEWDPEYALTPNTFVLGVNKCANSR